MIRIRLLNVLLVCSILVVVTTNTFAATVTYVFSGYILDNASNAFKAPGYPGINEGDSFTGKVVFDDSAVDTEPWEVIGRFYLAPNPASLIQMTVNGLTFTSSTSAYPIITTRNNYVGLDSFDLSQLRSFDLPSGWSASAQNINYSSSFALTDFSQTAFSTDAIPQNFVLSNFQQQNEYAGVRFTIQTTNSGTITLNHPGGTSVYTGSVDLIGVFSTLAKEGATLPGDFNGSGTVDAADYVYWRKYINTPADYALWRAHFSAIQGNATSISANAHTVVEVPEPSQISLLLITAACVRRKPRRCQNGIYGSHTPSVAQIG